MITNYSIHFFDLVTIDSPTGEEEKIANFLTGKLQALGLFVKQDSSGNIYARLDGQGAPMFFSAHLDTVEPGRNIKPLVKNGYVTSDGTTILGADNKVAIACILEVLEAIRGKKHRTIEIIFTRSEEVGNYGAINFDYSFLTSKRGYCFDSSTPVGTVITASPFYERFDIKIIGKAAHASKPENAINAIILFQEILDKIKLGRIDDDTLCNIGVISSGDVRNTIPGELVIQGEIRSFIERKLLAVKNKFIFSTENVLKKYNASWQQDWVRENPGYKHTSAKAKNFIKDTKKLIAGYDILPTLIQTAGVSDANIFNDKDLLCINMGSGVENAHTKHERAKLSEMQKLVTLILVLSTH